MLYGMNQLIHSKAYFYDLWIKLSQNHSVFLANLSNLKQTNQS